MTRPRMGAPRSLDPYRRKRDPARTTEPFGAASGRSPADRGPALRGPAARRPPPALGPAAGDRRGAGQLGDPARPVGRHQGAAAGGADRGPSARVRQLRGPDPGRQLRRRGDDPLGLGPLSAGRRRRARGGAGGRQAGPRAARTQAARALGAGAHQGRGRQAVAVLQEGRRRGRRQRAGGGDAAIGGLRPDRRSSCATASAATPTLAARAAAAGAPRAALPARALSPMLADVVEDPFTRAGLDLRAQVRRHPRPHPAPRRRPAAAAGAQRA